MDLNFRFQPKVITLKHWEVMHWQAWQASKRCVAQSRRIQGGKKQSEFFFAFFGDMWQNVFVMRTNCTFDRFFCFVLVGFLGNTEIVGFV